MKEEVKKEDIKRLKNDVISILIKKPKTRNKDMELIYQYLILNGLPTDFKELRKLDFNLCESIRRTRCLVQATNPLLQADEEVRRHRKEKEERVRKVVRGV